jgi:transposase
VAIAVGLDVHRGQITFDALDRETGEVSRGRIRPADRIGFRRWLQSSRGRPLTVAVEATTGWRFVVEELRRAGAEAHLAEPAEVADRRGSKRRAKTDRRDARHLRELLVEGRLPEAWIPPEHLLELRARVRLRKTLVDQRTEWLERIHAVLFHHGVALTVGRLDGRDARQHLQRLDLTPAACQQIEVALAMIDAINAQLAPLDRELRAYARRQPGCRALMRHYGIGAHVSTAILAELGDARRFCASRRAVRFAGLDITVHESDGKRWPGHLSRQGSPLLRWAAFEAAESACKPGSPDHAYYLEAKQRLGANRAVLAVARKLLRRAYHTLRELGDDALAPADLGSVDARLAPLARG